MSAAINSRPSRIMGILTAVLCCLFIAVTPVKALAAPAEGATVEHSGTSGTVTWEIYTDGTMVIRPTEGDEGTMASLSGSSNGAPWDSRRSSIKRVETQGTIHLGSSAAYMFCNTSNCTEMDLSGFDTSNVTDMSYMFYGSKATSLDLSEWNTSNVTNMNRMFFESKATSIDLSGWDTSKVTNMYRMFQASAATSLDLSGWDTSKVTDMGSMFKNSAATSLGDLSGWNTSSVTNMYEMFRNSAATSLDLFSWDTSKVTDMSFMFYQSKATSLDLSGWDTSNVTNMYCMFYQSKATSLGDLSGWNTSKVTNMEEMFYGSAATSLGNLSGWDTSSVTSMSSMFAGSAVTNLDLSGWDTSSVTDMGYMFYSSKATSLDLSGWNTSSVTNMSCMFHQSKATSLGDLSGWNTSSVTDMGYMFRESNATSLGDLSGWDTSNVTNMGYMFYGSAATSLDLSGWNTSSVTNMYNMFFSSKVEDITLGENFSFKGKNITSTNNQALLPTPPSATTTRKWIREDGTVDAKTPEELRDNYDANASAWAGKWIWEEKPTKYTVKFNPPAGGGYAGSMPDQKIAASEAGTLNSNEFSRFDYSFDHWDGSDGRTYTDGQTIPANTFNVGDTLTLTAVFTKDQHVLNFIDGVAEFTLKAGEKAVFSDLPGGSKYQIWEETPSGWQLIDQTNAAGTVVPNQTTDASFTNEYVPGTATFTLMAQKTLDGTLPGDGQFQFELIDSDNTVVQTVSNNAAGIVQFDQIVFRQPGTYVYQIREVRGDDPGISYDAHTEVVTITVSDDGHGNLTATSSSMTTLPSFENETKPGMLTVEKKVEGGGSDQVFTFEIELTNDKGMPLSNVHVVGETAE